MKFDPHMPMCWMKQVNAWSKKNCALGQPRATQSATHVMLVDVPMMHFVAHVSIERQPIVTQSPQSSGQLEQVS